MAAALVVGSAAAVAASTGIWKGSSAPESPRSPEGPVANIWIGAAGACVDSDAPAAYDPAASCGSFDAANDVAGDGDLIRVATARAYGAQTLTGSNGRRAAATIRPDRDGSRIVVRGGFTIGVEGGDGPDHLIISGVQLGSDTTSFTNESTLTIWDGADDIVIDDWEGPSFDCWNCTNTTIANSDWGPCSSSATRVCVSRVAQSAAGTCCVTIEDTTFHDIWCGAGAPTACGAWHTDGLAVFGSDRLTLRRLTFYRNDITNIRFQNNAATGRANTNVVVENSWFGRPCTPVAEANCSGEMNSNSIDIDDQAASFTLRFNTFADQSYPQCTAGTCGTAADPAVVLGNIYSIQASFCSYANVRMRSNATGDWGSYGGGACAPAPGDANGAFPTFADAQGTPPDFHLTGEPGIADDLVAAGCIGEDVDRAPRAPSNCDAGSDER